MTISVPDAREDIQAAEVEEVMENILQRNIFSPLAVKLLA